MSQSKEWECKLERGLRLWHQLQQRAQPVEEWVSQAEDVLNLQMESTQHLIDKHKVTPYFIPCSQGKKTSVNFK